MHALTSDVDTKLAAARTRLILDKPFLGALALRLPLQPSEAHLCPATASDGKSLYYNPDYIAALSDEQTRFALAHEALHCALSHFYRRGHRVAHRWDLACDYAVNSLLINDGLQPPPDAQYLPEYDGMTAEEIYPCLADNENDTDRELEREQDNQSSNNKDNSERQKQSDKNNRAAKSSSDERSSASPLMSQTELENLSTQWQQRMAAAAQQALQAGKLDGEMARIVDHLLQPKLSWRNLLAHYLTASARDDYSYTRPSTRRGDPAIYPSLRSNQVNVVVAIDTSGSITADEIQAFVSEVDALKSQLRSRLALLQCDSALSCHCPHYFEAWDEFSAAIEIRGGRGTDFRPVFDWVTLQDTPPDTLIYFTDAEGQFPDSEPDYPVVWLVKGKASVPFGERIQLN